MKDQKKFIKHDDIKKTLTKINYQIIKTNF